MKREITDIHSHILPCLDDGPMAIDQALLMARQAMEDGVKTVIATPHCFNGVYNLSKEDIICACDKFRERLEEQSISVDIRPGGEIRLNHDTVKKYDQGELITLNNSGRYLLLELPETFLLDGVVMLLRQFYDRGLIPVIAHPERNRMILGRIGIVDKLISEGALLQITSSSLVGDFGRTVMKMAENLVKMGTVSFIASDIHPGRKYRMLDAVTKVVKLVGLVAAHAMVHEEAEKLLSFSSEKPISRGVGKRYAYSAS